jgi:hypothetical protein
MAASVRSDLGVVNLPDEIDSESRATKGGGGEAVSAVQDPRLRVRAPLSLSTSTSAKFVLDTFPFSASSVSSCSLSSLSSRWRQSCQSPEDGQGTAKDIMQERLRLPVHVPCAASNPHNLNIRRSSFASSRLGVLALSVSAAAVQVETISTQSREGARPQRESCSSQRAPLAHIKEASHIISDE